jgi:hypothetical protein
MAYVLPYVCALCTREKSKLLATEGPTVVLLVAVPVAVTII